MKCWLGAGLLLIVALASGCLLMDRIAERRFVSKLEGKPAPDFALEDLDGKLVRLSDLRGKPVLLAFWASG